MLASVLTAGLVASIFVMSPLAEQLEGMAAQSSDVKHYIQAVNPVALTGGQP
jgi:hypothetical protein